MKTAQLRNMAWDAYQNGDYHAASELYLDAARGYPTHSATTQLGIKDIAGLKDRAEKCAAMVRGEKS